MSRNPTYDELKQRIDELEKEAPKRKRFEKALLESEEKHRFLIKNLPSIVYKGYKDWSVEFFDRKIELLTGYDVDEYNSCRIKWYDIIVKEDIETARASFIRALKTDKSYVREYRIKSKAGKIHWIQERGQIVCDNKGEIEYVNGVFFDITEHREAEEALIESEEMARVLLNASTDAVVLLDHQGIILDVNSTCAQRFHKSVDEMQGSCIWDLFLPEVTVQRKANVKKVFESGKPVRMVDERQGIWNDNSIYPVCDSRGAITRVAVFARDITDHKRTEEHIHALTQQLMKAHEDERQMISRELHDRIGQDLSMLKIGFDTLFDGHPEVHPGMRQRISELTKTLHGSIMAVRDLAYDLRPPSLDQLGLARTIFQYCEDFSEKTGLSVDFNAAGMDDLRLDFDTEINMYRLVQEGLININKHADARQATIRLVASFPNIILRIEDDGRGFNVEDRLVAISNKKRMGLRSMGERVGLLEGKMRIQSRPTEGTKIFIEVPYQNKHDR
ncbi:MAG: PAS domain S-box protein [Desulfobacterales bacterium]